MRSKAVFHSSIQDTGFQGFDSSQHHLNPLIQRVIFLSQHLSQLAQVIHYLTIKIIFASQNNRKNPF